MSVHVIYYKDGAKMMRPVLTAAEYRNIRNSEQQRGLVAAIRAGDESLKSRLVQMNYSCLPNPDGSLKGSTRLSTSVGMDIDHIPQTQMDKVRDEILAKKDELGLLMLELSARGCGYHLAFRRRPELSQEENLRRASDLLGVDYDKGAKDITRVFFTTTEAELIYLNDKIFETTEAEILTNTNITNRTNSCAQENDSCNSSDSCSEKASGSTYPTHYHGIPFSAIIAKYWEVNNRGFEPTQGDRDTLTYQLACDLRHICGRSFEWLATTASRWKRSARRSRAL